MNKKLIPFDKLKEMAEKDPVVKAILEDRVEHVNEVCDDLIKRFGKIKIEPKKDAE